LTTRPGHGARRAGPPLAAEPPQQLLVGGEPLEPGIHWVRPELVAEIQFTAWSGAGRVRHPVYLGLREDKSAEQVVLAVPDPEAKRSAVKPRGAPGRVSVARRGPKIAMPPVHRAQPTRENTGTVNPRAAVVIAHAPKRGRAPDRPGGASLASSSRTSRESGGDRQGETGVFT
jgi:hypothetical protein